jgi:hypothetical protein
MMCTNVIHACTCSFMNRAEAPYFALIVLNRLEPENLVSFFGEGMKFDVKETFLTYRDDGMFENGRCRYTR